jgi:hypothetical protein
MTCRTALCLLSGLLAVFLSVNCKPVDDRKVPKEPATEPATKEKAEAAPEGQVKPGEEPPAPEDPEKVKLVTEGREAFRSCATCHCATDLRIKEDEDWVILNEVTTCIESGAPAPRLRQSILAYLRHPETLRPVLYDKDTRPEEGTAVGKISVPATAGSAYLKADRETIKKGSPSMVRLYWKTSEKEKTLDTPVGDYNVINYWLYRRTGKEKEERWMVSATNVDGCAALRIAGDVECYFSLDPTLYGTFTAEKKGEGYTLTFTLADISGNRMTLSKNGRVIDPRYRIVDAEGKTRAEGVLGNT